MVFSTSTTIGLFFRNGLAARLGRLGKLNFEILFMYLCVRRKGGDGKVFKKDMDSSTMEKNNGEPFHLSDHNNPMLFYRTFLHKDPYLHLDTTSFGSTRPTKIWLSCKRFGVEDRHHEVPIVKRPCFKIDIIGVCAISQGPRDISEA